MVLALLGLEFTILWVSHTVVPGQRAALVLDETTLGSLGVVSENLNDIVLPAHVDAVSEVDPLASIRCLHEATVLSTEAKSGYTAKPFIQCSL